MSKAFELIAENREVSSKNVNRRLRAAGQVPAVVYGAGKAPKAIVLDHNQIIREMENEAFFSHILTLKVDGKSEQVVIKDLQRHPYKPKIEHVDFLRIKAKEKLTMRIPIHFIGEAESPGVKLGGVVSKLMTDIDIRCLPADLPEYIALDVSKLNIGESKHLSELPLPKGVELVTPVVDEEHDHAVYSIHQPSVVEEPEKVEAAETEISAEQAQAAAEGEETQAE